MGRVCYILLISCLLFILSVRCQVSIVSWNFDLDAGSLSFALTASTLDITSLDCTKFYLQGSQAAFGQTVSRVQLTDCGGSSSAANLFDIQLTENDLNSVKLATGIATQLSNTFLSVDSGNGVVEGGNELQTYSQQTAIQASTYQVIFPLICNN